MKRLALILAVAFGLALPAHATEIFDVEGSWIGEGVLPIGPDAPLQPGRCEIDVKPKEDGNDVSITGKCFVDLALVFSDISIRVVRAPGGKVNAGFWAAVTGQTIQLSGVESATEANMVSTTDMTLNKKNYDVHLRLSSSDAENFAIRALVRPKGDEGWRRFAEISFRRTDS